MMRGLPHLLVYDSGVPGTPENTQQRARQDVEDIFTKEGVEEILNLQPKGRHAKPYQVKQARHVILKYRLGGASDVS